MASRAFPGPGRLSQRRSRRSAPRCELRLPPLLAAARAEVLSLHQALVTRALVRAIHGRGIAVIAWTVNDPELVRAARRAGGGRDRVR